jgi:hypothetical protein
VSALLFQILAAAELLSDTPLNHNQASFLQTVQACGTSLVETVNHVLDFTKLSGNSKSGGVENVIAVSKYDLFYLPLFPLPAVFLTKFYPGLICSNWSRKPLMDVGSVIVRGKRR